MRLKKESGITTILLLLSITIFYSCKDVQRKLPPTKIPVIEVIQQDVPIYQEFVGQVYGFKDIPIRARVDGFLTGIHFNEGFPVKQGQLLYTIDPQPLQAKVAETMGQLAKAKTELVRANNELARIKPLAEVNAVSQSDLDAALARKGAAKASVEAAEASLKLARINLSYTNIKSPINGLIGKTQAKEGEYVGKNPNPVILNTVSRIDIIHVEFFLTEAEYLRFSKATKVDKRLDEDREERLELILADGSVHPYKGKIDFIDRNIDPTIGAILLQASFPNPEKLIRPGQFAKVKALVDIAEDGLLIPQRCVKELQGKFTTYVVNDSNKIELREIKTNGIINNLYLIEKGVKAGEKIVFEGIQKVKPDMVVDPVMTNFSTENIKKPE